MYVMRFEGDRKKFCSRKCRANHPRNIQKSIDAITKVDSKGKNNGRYKDGRWCYRDAVFSIKPKICEICGNKEGGRKYSNIVVHHKDGNRGNNNIENFLVVCQGCHLILHKLGRYNEEQMKRLYEYGNQTFIMEVGK